MSKPKYQTLEEIEFLLKDRQVEEIKYLDGTFYRG